MTKIVEFDVKIMKLHGKIPRQIENRQANRKLH